MKKSGKKNIEITLHSSFDWAKDYLDAHVDRECKGSFEFKVSEDVLYPVDALGPVLLPIVPHIACPVCNAAYPIPGWDEFLDKHLSIQLLANGRLLTTPQMRFLRMASGLTQVQVADRIDMERTLYNKKESESNHAHQFNTSEQVQLKLFFAKEMGITDVDFIYDHIIKLEEKPGLVNLSRKEVEEFPPLKKALG